MITTTAAPGEASRTVAGRARWRRLLALVGLCTLLVSCTNSKLIIGPLYNKLDDRIRSQFNELGDFDEQQQAAFEQAVGTYHVWHRQSEMPQYAALIQDMAASIAAAGSTTDADVQTWMAQAEAHSRAARECHPINFMVGTIRSLTDEQFDSIERHLQRERQESRERYESRTPEERLDYRFKQMVKWAGRINLELTGSQRAALRTSLGRQISLREEYYALSDAWNRKLFTIARDQEAADYDARLSAHLSELWSMLEAAYPEEWAANRKLWQDTLLKLIQSLSDEQRRNVSQWISTLGDTALAISQDEPSFQVGNDPSVGCLVDTSS